MMAFCEKVKEKVRSDEYLALSEYFHEYSNGRITMGGLKEMVEDLLGEYPGFFDEFLSVFNFSDGPTKSAGSSNKRKKPVYEGVGEIRGYNRRIRLKISTSFQKPDPESIQRNKTKDLLFQALGFCEKVMKKASSEDYLALLKCLHDYATGKITMVGVKMMMADYFPDFMNDFDHVLEFYASLSRSSSGSEGKNGDKGEKPNEKLDNKLTPSYKFLPKHISGVHGSGVTELGKEVLNSCCFSEGSGNFHRPVRPRDSHEMMLNKHEDELFERDMLMAWKLSTKENATKLFKAIKEGEIKKPTVEDVNKHFTGYNFRFIEKMYGNSGSQVVDQLRRSPETILPVLINRLNKMEITFTWN